MHRSVCAITGSNDLEHLYTFKNFPIFMGCTNAPREDDIFDDLSWVISKNSGLIQLQNLLSLDILYKNSHGSGSVGKIWNLHHSKFAEFINNFNIQSVLEVGGAHGILFKNYHENHNKNIEWTIIDPNANINYQNDSNKLKIINGFFDNNFKIDNINTVVHSHVLEHMYNPNDFFNHISNMLKINDYHIFSVPNMKKMLKKNYNNTINFEHTLFLTEPYIEYLLAKNNFKIIEKQYFLNDNSIFYATQKTNNCHEYNFSKSLYNINKKIFLNYINYYTKLIDKINNITSKNNNPVFLFGAHIFSQYLIAFNLNTKKIVSILDNDENKQGKRLYGTNLFVESPNVLKKYSEPIVILKAGTFSKEIKRDIIKNINSNTIFI